MFILRFMQSGQFFKSLNGDKHGQTEQSNLKSVRHSFHDKFHTKKRQAAYK